MKVVFAASLEQKRVIRDLIEHLYHSVFPLYFDKEEIKELSCCEVLNTPCEKEEWLETANDAYRIIASLQVIISLLELNSLPIDYPKYETIFTKNKCTLERYHISFPFTYDQFSTLHSPDVAFSMFSKAANEYLI